MASGLFNPVTGRKFVKSWEAEHIFPLIHEFYPKMEKKLGADFFEPRPLIRLFPTAKASNDWDSSSPNPFISELDEQIPEYIDPGFGGIKVSNAGILRVKSFLQAAKEFFGPSKVKEGLSLNTERIEILHEGVRWEEYKAKKVVFCEGPEGRRNPYFSWLPFSPTKGELMEIETNADLKDSIFTKRVFFLPLSGNRALVGATYDRTNLNLEKTPASREYLEERLRSFFKSSYRVVDHRVGIRPNVKDRRPLAGFHSEHEQIGILNGLGSKGVSLGPFVAQFLVNAIIKEEQIPKELNISRFFAFFEG